MAFVGLSFLPQFIGTDYMASEFLEEKMSTPFSKLYLPILSCVQSIKKPHKNTSIFKLPENILY